MYVFVEQRGDLAVASGKFAEFGGGDEGVRISGYGRDGGGVGADANGV